jgi:hypothetical protein
MNPEYLRNLSEAVARIIELDSIDLAGTTLSQEQFYERCNLRDATEAAEIHGDPVLQGILMPLKAWDEPREVLDASRGEAG